MGEKILSTIITIVVSGLFGYCVSYVRYKLKNEKAQNEALKTLLQNALTNIYYKYNELGEIPDYALKNWVNMKKPYKELNGNDYIDALDTKIKQLKVIVTGTIK